MDLQTFSDTYNRIEDEVRRAFLGQDDVLASVLVGILAKGHVLIEGVPGVGKTLLVRVLGKVLGCHFRRIQFTPDLMPSDVTGSTTYNAQAGTFEFKHGPVFTHVLLADEINRAPAKTQAAMLESMQERSVTVDGKTYPLPRPFFVLATQNPIESAGTYPLPEAQLDRFLFKLLINHPTSEVEEALLRNVRDGFDANDLDAVGIQQVCNPDLMVKMQDAVQAVHIDDKIIHYIASLVANTRRHRAIQFGASPRAAIALLTTSRVEAAVQGRNFVVPDDVKTHGRAVLRHRLILQPDAEIEGVTTDEVVEGVLHETQVPGMGESSRPSATAGQHYTHRPQQAPPAGVSPLLSTQPTAPTIGKTQRPVSSASAVPADLEPVLPEAPAPSGPARAAAPPSTGPVRPAGLSAQIPPWEKE